MAWIHEVPAWFFALLLIGFMAGLSSLGVIFARYIWERTGGDITHNDVAGPIIATIGTVLAVMLSFMVVIVWQEFDQAAATVQSEASAIADLDRISKFLPNPTGPQIHRSIVEYVDIVVNEEWPLMEHGKESLLAHRVLADTVSTLAAYSPKTPAQQSLQQQGLALVNAANDARRERFFENEQSIPGIMWLTMIFIGTVTIAFCCFFRVRSLRAHITMTAALAAVIAATFVLIVKLDLPFRGDVHVAPTAFEHVAAFLKPDPSR